MPKSSLHSLHTNWDSSSMMSAALRTPFFLRLCTTAFFTGLATGIGRRYTIFMIAYESSELESSEDGSKGGSETDSWFSSIFYLIWLFKLVSGVVCSVIIISSGCTFSGLFSSVLKMVSLNSGVWGRTSSTSSVTVFSSSTSIMIRLASSVDGAAEYCGLITAVADHRSFCPFCS